MPQSESILKSEWEPFKVNDNNSGEFANVFHVTHVPDAIRIIEDKYIHATIVRDSRRLNRNSNCVVWASPNDYDAGSFYGNVEISFDWEQLISGKKYYWIEHVPEHENNTCRILISSIDHPELTTYDPIQDRGPWQKRAGHHYRNKAVCLQVMIEEDLDISGATAIRFVNHHRISCKASKKTCPWLGRSHLDAETEFVGVMLARHLNLDLPGFTEKDSNGNLKPSISLNQGMTTLYESIKGLSLSTWGSVRSTDPASSAIARLLAWYAGLASGAHNEDARNVLRLFASHDDAWTSIVNLVSADTKVSPSVFDYKGEIARTAANQAAATLAPNKQDDA